MGGTPIWVITTLLSTVFMAQTKQIRIRSPKSRRDMNAKTPFKGKARAAPKLWGCLHGFAADGSDYDRIGRLTGLKLLLYPLSQYLDVQGLGQEGDAGLALKQVGKLRLSITRYEHDRGRA